jgi:hypothetical protein
MKMQSATGWILGGLAFLLGSTASCVSLAEAVTDPAMGPLERYLEGSEAAEVALARSAAPASISADADVLTLTKQGYQAGVKGKNGFVCLVERSWAKGLADATFWDPKFRAPTCYNPAAARSVLPRYLEKTGWVLAGVSKSEMIARTRVELSSNSFLLPESGAMAYMQSKQTHLSDAAGHWHPHLMFYLANTKAATWGANLEGTPVSADDASVFAQETTPEPVIVFFVPVTKWSDSTPEEMTHSPK